MIDTIRVLFYNLDNKRNIQENVPFFYCNAAGGRICGKYTPAYTHAIRFFFSSGSTDRSYKIMRSNGTADAMKLARNHFDKIKVLNFGSACSTKICYFLLVELRAAGWKCNSPHLYVADRASNSVVLRLPASLFLRWNSFSFELYLISLFCNLRAIYEQRKKSYELNCRCKKRKLQITVAADPQCTSCRLQFSKQKIWPFVYRLSKASLTTLCLTLVCELYLLKDFYFLRANLGTPVSRGIHIFSRKNELILLGKMKFPN
jgi:hypothetical protein